MTHQQQDLERNKAFIREHFEQFVNQKNSIDRPTNRGEALK